MDTKSNTYTSIPQKLAMPFLPYKTMKQLQRQTSIDRNQTSSSLYRKQKTVDTKTVQTNLQVVGIYAGGHQIFVRISARVCFVFVLCCLEKEEWFSFRHNDQRIIELCIMIVHFWN
jgi:hypothetical protein